MSQTPLLGLQTFRDSQVSASSSTAKFRQSTDTLPSRSSKDVRYRPAALWWPLLVGTPLMFILFGVGAEVALALSRRNDGFAIPDQDRIRMSFVSVHVMITFGPTVAILPFTLKYRDICWYVRSYHPYVVLSRGNVTAEEGLVTDYLALGPFHGMFHASKYKHRVVFWACITTLVTFSFQPFSSSMFFIQQRAIFTDVNITSIQAIGLAPDVMNLNAFIAASGFIISSVLNHLDDPPFIDGGWTTAEFIIPKNVRINASAIVDTVAIESEAHCEKALRTEVDGEDGARTRLSLKATNLHGCEVVVPVNMSVSNRYYGVVNVPCGESSDLDVTQQPVMFWFLRKRARDGHIQARTVFCSPSIELYTVQAAAWLKTRTIASCIEEGHWNGENNVTGSPLFGRAYNGLIFPPDENPFVEARSKTISMGLPDAIFRTAVNRDGIQSAFDSADVFSNVTSQIYMRYLALAARSIYFVRENSTLLGQIETYGPRIVVDPIATHALCIVMLFVGIIGLFIQHISRRQRRRLCLTTRPGSIGSILAMTSRSGFGQLLVPYDDEQDIEKKLDGLRFMLDRRTGAIVACDEGDEFIGLDDTIREPLLDLNKRRKDKGRSSRTKTFRMSSSQTALRTAIGHSPWRNVTS